jgi:hypothetical protein
MKPSVFVTLHSPFEILSSIKSRKSQGTRGESSIKMPYSRYRVPGSSSRGNPTRAPTLGPCITCGISSVRTGCLSKDILITMNHYSTKTPIWLDCVCICFSHLQSLTVLILQGYRTRCEYLIVTSSMHCSQSILGRICPPPLRTRSSRRTAWRKHSPRQCCA